MRLYMTAILASALTLGLAACDNGETDPTDGTDDTDTSDLPSNVSCSDGLNPDSVCTVTGTFTADFTFTADVVWVLDGAVFVGDDADNCPTLTVDAGTTVYGATGKRSFLAIARCAKIDAQGTADAPIVFTSGAQSRNPGDWGGIILNGYGLNNLCADPNDCNVESEGDAGFYGGNDNADDSGILKYVVVTHAGDQVTDEDQLNGIAFQGVGSGTEVDYIQIHRNRDDGIEFFGGAAQVKHVVITGAHDDSIDWTNGWTGKLQHAVVQQYDDAGDRGIEADNNEDDNAASPRSKPTMSHVTLLGSKNAPEGDDGMKLRRGTGFNGYSFLVANFGGDCIDVDNRETYENALSGANLSGELTIENSIVVDCDGGLFDEDDATDFDPEWTPTWLVADWFTTLNSANTADETGVTTDYIESTSLSSPNWASKGDATSGGAAPSDSWFDRGTHIGGVAPGSDWTAGWIVTDMN